MRVAFLSFALPIDLHKKLRWIKKVVKWIESITKQLNSILLENTTLTRRLPLTLTGGFLKNSLLFVFQENIFHAENDI